MSISKIALAIPIVIGIGSGCSTMGQHGVDTTGAMWTDGSMSERLPRDAAAQAYMQGTGSQGKDQGSPGGSVSPDAGSGSSGSMGSTGSSQSSDSTGSSGSTGSSDSMGSSGAAGSSDSQGSGSMGSSDSSGSMGSSDQQGPSGAQGSGGAMGSTDQGSTSGAGDVKGHADDQTVRGKLSKVSREEISITPKGGEAKTLKISPQTVVTINGKDAKPTQLKQGQQVRASYQDQDGEDVAVKIEVGKATARKARTGGPMQGRGGSDHAGHGHGGAMGGSTR